MKIPNTYCEVQERDLTYSLTVSGKAPIMSKTWLIRVFDKRPSFSLYVSGKFSLQQQEIIKCMFLGGSI